MGGCLTPLATRTAVYADTQKERCTVAQAELSMGPLYTAEKPKWESQSSHPSLGAQQPLLIRGASWRPHPQGRGEQQDTFPPALHTPSFPHTSWDLPSSTPKGLRHTCNRRAPHFLCEAQIVNQRHCDGETCSLVKGALRRSDFDLNEQETHMTWNNLLCPLLG